MVSYIKAFCMYFKFNIKQKYFDKISLPKQNYAVLLFISQCRHNWPVPTPIECSAIGLLTLCLTETHIELRTQRVDLLENNIHYIQNSTSPISFKFRSQIKIPSLVPFVPVGV